MEQGLPIIDVRALISTPADSAAALAVAREIGAACRSWGFFYIVGHGVDDALQAKLEALSRRFFALDLATKQEIRMSLGGRAWRGYFPVGGELTSGQADWKEGIYFGAELSPEHPLVRAGTPLHGANLFPASVPELRPTVLAYLAAMTRLAEKLMQGIALSLGLPASYFHDRYTADPLVLFRIFHYPPPLPSSSPGAPSSWGVGEHTDYGVLTILKQDDAGGLQVRSTSGWVDAPPIPGSLVCNLGDMLDRMTGGRYRSTPHRVERGPKSRLSFPFFYDPNWQAEVAPIELDAGALPDDKEERWDHASVHEFRGTYGDYVLSKVAKVFPELLRTVLHD